MATSRAHPGHWTTHAFVADDGSIPFKRFVKHLPDSKYAALHMAMERVLERRGIELLGTPWLRALGGGIHEFRVRHDASEIARMFGGDDSQARRRSGAVLLRVFVHFYGDRAVLLLNGYDKGRDPSRRRQQTAIAEARQHLRQFRRR